MNDPAVPPIVVACAQRALLLFQRFVSLSHDQQADARQVALLSAWEAYTALSTPNDPAPLLRSAWNALRRWWRSERSWRGHTTELDYQDEEGEWCVIEIMDCEDCVEEVLARLEVESVLERLGLSDKEREMLRLLSEGYSQQEVADVLGCSRQWVAWRLGAIRRRAVGLSKDSE